MRTKYRIFCLCCLLQYNYYSFSQIKQVNNHTLIKIKTPRRRVLSWIQIKMAKLVEAIDQELLCTICRSQTNNPKVLPCLHSFCKACLEDLIAHADEPTFFCPLCKSCHIIKSNGVEAYKTNFTLCNLLEARKIHEAEKTSEHAIRCGNGLDDNDAFSRCIECGCYLCETCEKQHRLIKATRNHKIVPITDISKDIRKLEHKRYCIEHEGEELKLYCKDCEEVICRDCTIDEHKGHSYNFITKIKSDLESRLEGLVEKVDHKLQVFEQHTIYLDGVRAQSTQNIEECHHSIRQFFDNYRAVLKSVEDRLHATLVEANGEVSMHLATESESVELSKAKMESAKLFTNQLLDKGIPVDIAMMSKQACLRLEQLQNENWERGSVQPSRWAFVKDEDPLKSKVRGGISRSEIQVDKLTQPVQGKNQFKIKLSPEVHSTNCVVVATVTTEKGERLPGVEVKKEAAHLWNVNYQIRDDGLYEIRVTVDGVEAQGSPFKRKWLSKLPKGTRVCRGKDWKWGDQDGNENQQGVIAGWAGEVGASDNWVKVKWDNKRQNNYRWGAEGAYDLMILV